MAARRQALRKVSLVIGALSLACIGFSACWVFRRESDEEIVIRRPKHDVPNSEFSLVPRPSLVKAAVHSYSVRVCEEVFDIVDHNDDGYLDSAEVHVAVLLVYDHFNKLPAIDLHLEVPNKEEVKQMIRSVDSNGDGRLDNDEFVDGFVDRFLHQVVAKALARVFTHKVLVPLAAVALGTLEEQSKFREKMENTIHDLVVDPKQKKRRNSQHTNGYRDILGDSKLVSRVVSDAIPIINIQVAENLVKVLRFEKLLLRLLSPQWQKPQQAEQPKAEVPRKKIS